MTTEDRSDFFHHAWIKCQVYGKTNLLEQYTSGFISTQLSAKQGINKYGREVELQLLAEFKQPMEYKTFHGQKSEDLTYDKGYRAANMANLFKEKINRGHTPENPVIKGRSVLMGGYKEAYTRKRKRRH